MLHFLVFGVTFVSYQAYFFGAPPCNFLTADLTENAQCQGSFNLFSGFINFVTDNTDNPPRSIQAEAY